MQVLLLANNISGLISFRKEVVEAILRAGHKVIISAPYDERMSELDILGASCVVTEIDRRSTNPFTDIRLLISYKRLIKQVKPDVVLTYTIKPNIYGGVASRLAGVPQIANITGLGTAVENPGLIQKIIIALYKVGLKKTKKVFFQNNANRLFCISHHMVPDCTEVIPGSGVNLVKFQPLEYPPDDVIKFLYIGRLMTDKGTKELFSVARRIREQRKDVEFHIVGGCEDSFEDELKGHVANNILVFHGRQTDVRPFIEQSHCLIHPSYHEGMSNVILESCASARPIITTFANGCKDAVDNGVNGLLAKVKDADDLFLKVEEFLSLPWNKKKEMGLAARAKVEHEFDRNIVVNKYLNEIEQLKK